MPAFSYRERFVIVLGIAILVFSAVAIFGGDVKAIFISLTALCIVSVMVVQLIQELRSTAITLLQSEERFRLLLDEVEDYAIFAVAPNGTITSWNYAAEHIAGYSAQEIIGQPFSTLRTTHGTSASDEIGRAHV